MGWAAYSVIKHLYTELSVCKRLQMDKGYFCSDNIQVMPHAKKTHHMSEKKSRKRKLKKEKIDEHVELDSDENFEFIAGYTSGGAAYGLKYQEMAEFEKENNKTESNSK
jgi:hypothetical protein